MGAIAEAKQALLAALREVPGVRNFPDVGPGVDPPCTVLGPPALLWEGVCPDPTSARFLVYVVVTSDDQSMDRLYELMPQVAAALDAVRDATVIRADPGVYPTTNGNLPAYEIQVDMAL